MFKCSTCKKSLPRESFGNDSHAARGFSYRCKNCERARNSKQRLDPEVREHRRRMSASWRAANPGRVKSSRESRKNVDRDAHLVRTYALTSDAYKAMLAAQGDGCAICGKSPQENGRRLAVDHDHSCCPGKKSCGKCVRGLLCTACNHGIGRMEDDLDRMQSAIDYIRSHRR